METTPQKKGIAKVSQKVIEVLIPVHNLQKRGFERIANSIYSLNLQNFPVKVNIIDSSTKAESKILLSALKNLNFNYIRVEGLKDFNKPILLNQGIKQTTGEFLLCTDADYIFSPDISENLLKKITPETMVIKKVRMLPKMEISFLRIENWFFDTHPFNPFGDLADGGCQFAARSWFEYCGGYDERMVGWCGMDNDMTKRFRLNGGQTVWMEEGEILHQWHPIEKGRTKQDIEKMKFNWSIRDNDYSIIRNKK